MQLPEPGNPLIFPVSDTHEAVITLTKNQKFRVTIDPIVRLSPGEKYRGIVQPDRSLDFDSIAEVFEHLHETADGEYKKQFIPGE